MSVPDREDSSIDPNKKLTNPRPDLTLDIPEFRHAVEWFWRDTLSARRNGGTA
jgi:hypothetical protein